MINKRKRRITAVLVAILGISTILFDLPAFPKIEAKADTSYVTDNERMCFYANINVWEDTSKSNLLHTYTKAMGNIKGAQYNEDDEYYIQKLTLKDFTRNLYLYADNKYAASSTFGNYQRSQPSGLTYFNGSSSDKVNAVSDSWYIEDEDYADDYTYDAIIKFDTIEKEDAFNACLINFNDTDHSIYKYGIRFKNDEVKALYPDYATYTVTWFEGTAKEQVTGIDDIITISAEDLANIANKKVMISNASGDSKDITLLTENFFDFEIPEVEGAELTGIMPCIYNGPSQSQMYEMVYSDGTAFFLGDGTEAYEEHNNISHITNISILKNFKTTAITSFDVDLSKRYAPNLKNIQRAFSDSDDNEAYGKFLDYYYPCMASEITLIPDVTYDGGPNGAFINNHSINKIFATNKHSCQISYCLAENCPFLEELNIEKVDDAPIYFLQAPVCRSGWGTEDGLITYTNDVIVNTTFLYDECKTNVYDELPSSIEGIVMAVFNSCKNTQAMMKVDLSIFNKLSNTFNAIAIGYSYKNSGFDAVMYAGTGPLGEFRLGVESYETFDIYIDKDVKVTEIKGKITEGNTINIHPYFYNSDGTENEFTKFLLTKGNLSKIFSEFGNYHVMFNDTLKEASPFSPIIKIETPQIIDRNTPLNEVAAKIDKSKITGKIRRNGDNSYDGLNADLGNLGTYWNFDNDPNPTGPENIYFYNTNDAITERSFGDKDYFVIKALYYDVVLPDIVVTNTSIYRNSSYKYQNDVELFVEKSDNVVSRELQSIWIVKPPTKTNYAYGESFDKTGMKVNAKYKLKYESGREKEVTDEDVTFDVEDITLTDSITSVNVSVTNGNITKTAAQDITVKDTVVSSVLDSINIYNHADKLVYKQGEFFDDTGLSVDAIYKDTYASGKTINRTVPRVNYSITDKDAALTDLNKTAMEITFTDNGITKTVNEAISVNKYIVSTVLDSIYVDKNPDKTIYKYGEVFNDDGMKVNAVYKNTWSDGSNTTSEVKDIKYFVDHTTPLVLADTEKAVYYTDDNVTKATNIPITVNNYIETTILDDIEIKKLPDKTNYLYGESFDSTGLVVDAYYKDIYADKSTINRIIENVPVIADKTKLYDTDTDITLSFSDNGILKSKKINVYVKDVVKNILLDNIRIVENPNKLVYKEGEIFDDTGLKINAVYKNIWLSGKETYTTSERVAYNIINKGKLLTLSDKIIEASFTDNGITKTDSINIFVKPALVSSELDSIVISHYADKTNYLYGETFDKSGLVIDAFYKLQWSDGSITYEKKLNVPFTVENKTFKLDDYYITISVTDNGIKKTVKQPVLINDAIKETVLDKISIATPADKTLYYKDEVFDKKGLTVNAIYKNIWYSGRVTTSEIKNVPYDITDAERKLDVKDTFMGLTFTDNGVSRSAEQNINVINKEISVNEQKPDEETKTEIVNTADNINIYYYLLLLTISAGVMISLKRIKKCEKI